MTSVAQAIEAIGIGERDGEDVVLTVIAADGKVINHLLPEIAEEDVSTFPALYTPSGTFKHGTVSAKDGRTRDNVARVLWVPLDCDLLDWLQTPKDKATLDRAKADLWASTDEALDAMLAAQRADIERVITQVGFPIHRLDVTGYGHCAYLRIADDDQRRVDDAGAAAKHLIGAINAVAGYQLADPQASDPGPRITRVPGSFNCKGAAPRLVRTLYQIDGTVPLGTNPARRQSVVTPVQIPDVGRGLDQAGCDAIVRAVAPLWGPGARNGIAFGLGGMMAKVKMPESQAVAIVTALADGDDELADRLSAVKRSYARVRSGRETAGFTWLRDVLADDALAEVDRALGVLRPRVTLTMGARPERSVMRQEVAFDPTPPPKTAFYGWFGRYVTLIAPTTEGADAFHLGSALVLAAATVGRRVYTSYASDELYANIYALLIGPAGVAKKDTAIKRALKLPQLPGPGLRMHSIGFEVLRDIGSSEGIVSALRETPNILLYITEFSKLMGNARRQSTNTIIPRLIEAFDTPPILQNKVKGNPLEARLPYLSVIAAIQPKILAEQMGEGDVSSGFANRWMYFVGSGSEPKPSPPELDRDAAWRLFRDFLDCVLGYPEGTCLPFLEEARERWDAWYIADYRREVASEEEDTMHIRLAVMIQKVALLYAISDGAKGIGDRHVAAAIDLIEWMWGNIRRLIQTWGETAEAALERKVIETLDRKGPVTQRKLQQSIGHRMGPGVFSRTIKAMHENGTIGKTDDGRIALAED